MVIQVIPPALMVTWCSAGHWLIMVLVVQTTVVHSCTLLFWTLTLCFVALWLGCHFFALCLRGMWIFACVPWNLGMCAIVFCMWLVNRILCFNSMFGLECLLGALRALVGYPGWSCYICYATETLEDGRRAPWTTLR